MIQIIAKSLSSLRNKFTWFSYLYILNGSQNIDTLFFDTISVLIIRLPEEREEN